ncbi:MAG: 3'-5' exoribonuclease [Odoribacteraceae bacterium]|jgi:DNA polymerase-3 subunit epsilon|nr:3'-5' exoribonuclease [Odoribacteraceae bacterium]
MKKRFIAENFAAIDFETANLQRSSICSIGVVIVRERRITERIYRLVRPVPNYYSSWATRVHGLSYQDTDLAPDFPRAWEDVHEAARSLPFVAHNSAFEQECLQEVYGRYGLEYPYYEFHCTFRTATFRLPWLCNHRLHTVSAYLGHTSHARHHALHDAEACAMIALHLFA